MAEEISSNIAIRPDELSVKLDKFECDQVLKTFPVLYMNFETSSAEIFVNLEELVYMPGLIDHFLTNDKEKQSTAKKSDETTVEASMKTIV